MYFFLNNLTISIAWLEKTQIKIQKLAIYWYVYTFVYTSVKLALFKMWKEQRTHFLKHGKCCRRCFHAMHSDQKKKKWHLPIDHVNIFLSVMQSRFSSEPSHTDATAHRSRNTHTYTYLTKLIFLVITKLVVYIPRNVSWIGNNCNIAWTRKCPAAAFSHN
jgi:hypothetical protein